MVAEPGMRCMEARLQPARAEATKVIILSPGLARPGAQVQVPVKQLGQGEIQGQGGWQDQPSIGHQAAVVKGDVDAVGVVKWQHLLGAPDLGQGLCFQNHYPRSTGAPSYPFSTPRHSPFRWIRA